MAGQLVPWAGVQPSTRLLPLTGPRLPVLSLPAAAPHLPGLAASRVHHADLSQLSPPPAAATGIPHWAGAGGAARGQGAPSHSLVSAGGGWRGQEGSTSPCGGSRGPGSHMGQWGGAL